MDKLKEFGLKLESLTKEYFEILAGVEPSIDGGRGIVNAETKMAATTDEDPTADGTRGVTNDAVN